MKNRIVIAAALAAAGCAIVVGNLGAVGGAQDTGVLARLEAAAQRDMNDYAVRLKLGTMLLDEGRTSEGTAWLREATKINRDLDATVEAIISTRVAPATDAAPRGGPGGADVILSDIQTLSNHGVVGTVRAYTLGSHTCNIGTQNLEWVSGGSPGYAMNAYRLKDGRLVQLGMSFAKTACCAFAGNGCGIGCNGAGGNQLGIGCLDVYDAGWNSIQSALAARSAINPYTGAFSSYSTASGNAIFKRLQVDNAAVTAPQSTGAQFFVEGVYVSSGDSAGQNWLNNATYKRVNADASGNFSLTGAPFPGIPAIQAWRDHGLGVGVPDTSVTIQNVDIPLEGRFVAGSKVIDNGNGTWRYEYAVFNLNSDKAGGSFRVPVPAGVAVSGVGFSAPLYHSGEPYSNDPWLSSTSGGAVTWTSPQTFAQNANTNALRWGTMYNFWFTADAGPDSASATLGLFKPHSTQTVTLSVPAPGSAPCPADLDGDGQVGSADLAVLLGSWGAGGPADFDGNGVGSSDLAVLLGSWGPCA